MGRRTLIEGVGFRLGWDRDGGEFVGLVGTGDWAVELTVEEWTDFGRLAIELAQMMAAMAIELMDEEALSVELETGRIWMEAEGFPIGYGLRFIMRDGRGVEGAWSAEAVPGLLAAVAQMDLETSREDL